MMAKVLIDVAQPFLLAHVSVSLTATPLQPLQTANPSVIPHAFTAAVP